VIDLVRYMLVLLAPVVVAYTSPAALTLVGVAALVATALIVGSRSATVLTMVLVPRTTHATRRAAKVAPLVPQRDPDAPGRVRPRAPGMALG